MWLVPIGIDLITNPGILCYKPSNCTVSVNDTIVYDNTITICTAQPNIQFWCIWYTGQPCPVPYSCTNDSYYTNIKVGYVLSVFGILCTITPCILMCFRADDRPSDVFG